MKWYKVKSPGTTLYYQKYTLTHPNNSIQVFQSLPWPQVYKSKHLGIQTASTNICERMGRSQELSKLHPGTVIGCNKSSHVISAQLNIPQSTVSGIITKWNQLGMTATQPQSGRPLKMTEWSQQMLRRKFKVKFICIAHFLNKTIQSSLHKIKELQRGAE